MKKINKKYFFSLLLLLMCFVIKINAAEESVYIGKEGQYSGSGEGIYTSGSNTLIHGYIYSSDGAVDGSAYCLQPGKNYASQSYYLDEEFSTIGCNNSSSFECGLAAIVNSGNDYTSTLIALRLWTAYKSEEAGDGWWDDDGNSSQEKIFTKTAEQLVNNKDYNGLTDPKINGVLYSNTAQGQATLTQAFSLFESTLNGSLNDFGGNGMDSTKSSFELSEGGNSSDSITISTGYENLQNSNVEIEGGADVNVTFNGNQINITAGGNCSSTDKIKIKITPPEGQKAGTVVKRYNPSKGTNYQKMLVLEEESGPLELEFDVTCKKECTSGCTEDKMKIQYNVPTSCSVSGENCYVRDYLKKETGECITMGDENTVDNTKSGSINDPSMCCIIKDCGSKKDAYDVTSAYMTVGTASNYCSLYCREDITLIFPDKKSALAGMSFKYDIKGGTASTELITTIIISEEECTSEIDFEKWKKDYETADELVRTTWNNYKRMEAISSSSPKQITASTNCNCDGCNTKYIPDPDRPGYHVCKDSWNNSCSQQYTKYVWEGVPYTITNKNGSTSRQSGSYSTPSVTCNCKKDSCSSSTGEVVEPNLASAKKAYENAVVKREQLIIDIQNCNLYDSVDYNKEVSEYGGLATGVVKHNIISAYPENNNPNLKVTYEDESYGTTPVIKRTKSGASGGATGYMQRTIDEISACPDGPTGFKSLFGSDEKEERDYWWCTGSKTNAKCVKKKIKLPKNLMSDFTMKMESDFYQSQSYYAEVYSGKVSPGTKPSDANYNNLESYIYPVSLYTLSGCYDIDFGYSKLGDAKLRSNNSIKIKDGKYTCIYEVVNETVYYECGESNCIVVCKDEELEIKPCDTIGECENGNVSNGYFYRTVDLANLFPNNRTSGYNWKKAASLITDIQRIGNDVWSEEPEYSFTLTPENIKNIQEYNAIQEKNAGGYLDLSIDCNKGFEGCLSDFLTKIRDDKDYAIKSDLVGRNKK